MKKSIIISLLLPLLLSCNNTSNNVSDDQSESTSISISESESISPSIDSSSPSNENRKLITTYQFKGDEKDKPGFAQGTITITPNENYRKEGYYLAYFADDDKLLLNYDEIFSLKITGESVSYDIKDGLYIPYEAKKIAIFESKVRYLKEQPDIEEASDIIDIEKESLELGKLQLKLGVTSDVHMNYDSLGFGSYSKWQNTINFFEDNKTDYVIITGDMTGETNLDYDYNFYIETIKNSSIPVDNVYECIGNHGNSSSLISYFTKYTSGNDEVRPFENSPYYYVFKEGKEEGYKDNLFIFMAQEIQGPSDTPLYDNFSKQQIDWLENTLITFNNENTNIFLIEHSPFLNWGPGDRHNGDYTRLITFKESYTQTMRLKKLLETYKDVIMMSGHTHLTYYENENYSDEYDSFCRMIHVSSGTQTSSYNHSTTLISDTDGRENNTPFYGSEGYIVEIYNDYIIYKGYNISTNKIIPAACIILPSKAYGGSGGPVVDPTIKDLTDAKDFYETVKGSGTLSDPYLISNELEFKLFTDQFSKSISKNEPEMFGYGQYFKQTADLDMSNFKGYTGTNASGSTRYTFAGNYNGDGNSLTVNIKDTSGNKSIFPYTYGVISNLKIQGQITGGTCAQPIRALYGKLINCLIDIDLTAEQTAGIIYSNYGYVYNVYATGNMKAGQMNAIASGNTSTKYHKVYYNFNNGAVTSSYGEYSNNLQYIVSMLNDKSHSEYQNAQSYLSGYDMKQFDLIEEKICFK